MEQTLSSRPPNRSLPNFRRHEGRRDQILDAALQVFCEAGYEKGRLEDVARLAGVGKAAVLYHFGSKEALVDAMVERHCLPSTTLPAATGAERLATGLNDPSAARVLAFVMSELRRLPALGSFYAAAMLRRLSTWHPQVEAHEARQVIGEAVGRAATRVLFGQGSSTETGAENGINPA